MKGLVWIIFSGDLNERLKINLWFLWGYGHMATNFGDGDRKLG